MVLKFNFYSTGDGHRLQGRYQRRLIVDDNGDGFQAATTVDISYKDTIGRVGEK